MPVLLSLFASPLSVLPRSAALPGASSRRGQSARHAPPDRSAQADDDRDKWVGLISAAGLCTLLASDLISLL